MSYCRWSSANWTCDIYCYENVSGGYTTHVAGSRLVGDAPQANFPLPGAPDETWAAYSMAHEVQRRWLETAKREPIGLAHDGETFNDPDLASFLKRLTGLRSLGYNVPEDVLRSLREEIAETSGEPTP